MNAKITAKLEIVSPEVLHPQDEPLLVLAQHVASVLPENRWIHTQGVVVTAMALARQHGADERKAAMAAYVHDVAKYWPLEQQRACIAQYDPDNDVLQYPPSLWHAHVGAIMAQTEYGVTDEEIIEAIRYHTSGHPNMGLLAKIVCLADYIEPGRNFSSVGKMRKTAMHHVEQALVIGFDETICKLIEQKKVIYPLTVMTRNALLRASIGE